MLCRTPQLFTGRSQDGHKFRNNTNVACNIRPEGGHHNFVDVLQNGILKEFFFYRLIDNHTMALASRLLLNQLEFRVLLTASTRLVGRIFLRVQFDLACCGAQ